MENLYTARPFLGSAKAGTSTQAVADQLETILNSSRGTGHASAFRVLAPVSIEVRPGCLARLFGAGNAWTRYDQIVMGPSPLDAYVATEPENGQPKHLPQAPVAETTSNSNPSQPHTQDTRSDTEIEGPSTALSLAQTWASLPRKVRFVGFGAAGLFLIWWLGSSGSGSKPTEFQVAQSTIPAQPVPPPKISVQPAGPTQTPPSQVVTSQLSVRRPVFQVGDRWLTEVIDHQNSGRTYRSERSVIEANSDKVLTTVKTLKSNYTRTVEYDLDWGLRSSRHPNGSATVYSPALPYMQFPAEPGKAWSQRVVETSSSGAEKVHQIQASIARWEPVTVPAGTFQALRVELSDQISINGVMVFSGTDVSWYVPQVKRSVRSEETSLDATTGERRRRTISLIEYVAR